MAIDKPANFARPRTKMQLPGKAAQAEAQMAMMQQHQNGKLHQYNYLLHP